MHILHSLEIILSHTIDFIKLHKITRSPLKNRFTFFHLVIRVNSGWICKAMLSNIHR